MEQHTSPARWSSSLLLSLLCAAAIALGMALYAIGQYIQDPSLSPWHLVIEHTWHVVALWVLIYVCVLSALHMLLLRPIKRIYLHLYTLGGGRIRPLALSTPVRELADIVEGINLMIRRMEMGPKGDVQASISHVAESLRTLAKERANGDTQLVHALKESAKELEHALTSLHAAP